MGKKMKRTPVLLILAIVLLIFIPFRANAQDLVFDSIKCNYDLYYPEEAEITCIAVCVDVWKIKIFNSDASALLKFINEMQPRHARKVKMASFLQPGNAEKNIPNRTVLAIIYPEEECGCKE